MKDSRLFQIVYRLLNERKCTAPSLAEEFEVSVRTIYRDIDALSAAGIPIYCVQGKNGGIYLMDHYTFDKGMMSDVDQQTILTAIQGINSLLPNMEDNLLTKLSGMWKHNSPDWIEIDFMGDRNSNRNKEKFDDIKQAVLKRKEMNITYLGRKGEQQQRVIHPIKIIYKGHAWYIQAFCKMRNDYRVFKMNRIYEWEVTKVSFDQVYEFPSHSIVDYTHGDTTVLKFSTNVTYRVYDEFDKGSIQEVEDGTIVTITYPRDAWFYSYLLSFMGEVEVISPNFIEDELLKRIEKVYMKYKHRT